MHYILLIITVSWNTSFGNPTITMQEFDSIPACTHVADEIIRKSNKQLSAWCESKG